MVYRQTRKGKGRKKMKKILLFDTSQGTKNLGDFIIMDAIHKQLQFLLENNFVISYPTHMPILHSYQMLRKNEVSKACREADYKFLCGTNLFAHNLLHITLGWNINLIDAKNYEGSISIGCGSVPSDKKINSYTKAVYHKALNHEVVHSTRDERTKDFLESLGFQAINTGCPTTWSLTEEFCKEIPKEKASNVVFTLTDYKQDEQKDEMLLQLLLENYENVYFWPQGDADYDYFRKMKNADKVKLLGANLASYHHLLSNDALDLDYVGTRLHAGIYAMQHKRRSIIINVDNRAKDMARTYGLHIIEREQIQDVPNYIKQEIETNIKLNVENIKKWKQQFEKCEEEK